MIWYIVDKKADQLLIFGVTMSLTIACYCCLCLFLPMFESSTLPSAFIIFLFVPGTLALPFTSVVYIYSWIVGSTICVNCLYLYLGYWPLYLYPLFVSTPGLSVLFPASAVFVIISRLWLLLLRLLCLCLCLDYQLLFLHLLYLWLCLGHPLFCLYLPSLC